MRPTDFSTASLPVQDQFEAWRHWFSPILDITRKAPEDGSFLASNKGWNLGGLSVSCVSAPPVLVKRTKANISKASVDHWVLSCCRNGITTIQTRDRLLEAPAGVPYLWSLGEPSTSERTKVHRIQILLPRDLFQDIGGKLDASRGSVLYSPMGFVLGEYMVALEGWLSSVTHDAGPRMGVAVREMIAACLAPSPDQMDLAREEINGFVAERARQAVRAHLRSPSLGPDVLCKMIGVSRSTLYRLFEYSGGVARYIQRQRLLQAYGILSDPLNQQSILSISEDLCFNDPSTFTRAFRHEFGCGPRDVRSAATNGNPIPPGSRSQPPRSTVSFGDFLRSA